MSNRKFNLDNEVQPEIHFRLLSISASKFENDWTSFPHSHHFTEIFFIKDGTGRMLIENESLPVSSNSLVVIGAQVTHTEFSDPENPLDYYVLGVEGLKLNTDKEPEYIHVPASANSPFIRQCFENILREMHNKQDRYAEICQHYLDILILYFCRKDHKIIHIMISDFLCYLYYLLISPKQKLCRPFHPVIVQIILKGLSVFFSEKLP